MIGKQIADNTNLVRPSILSQERPRESQQMPQNEHLARTEVQMPRKSQNGNLGSEGGKRFLNQQISQGSSQIINDSLIR